MIRWVRDLFRVSASLIGFAIGFALVFAATTSASEPAPSAPSPLTRSIGWLDQTPSGQRLLRQAQNLWKVETLEGLAENLRMSQSSRTDAVLTRHLDLRTGKEIREKQVTIYLRTSQSDEDIALDLAHELVHATSRADWDPYDPYLTPETYIQVSIEGKGGEVDALAMECQISLELAQVLKKTMHRCERYIQEPSQAINRDRIRTDFYRVGEWKSVLARRLRPQAAAFRLSKEAPRLFSSTGSAPYPVALFEEYVSLTRIACANTRKRLEGYPNRTLASKSEFDLKNRSGFFLRQRCSHY